MGGGGGGKSTTQTINNTVTQTPTNMPFNLLYNSPVFGYGGINESQTTNNIQPMSGGGYNSLNAMDSGVGAGGGGSTYSPQATNSLVSQLQTATEANAFNGQGGGTNVTALAPNVISAQSPKVQAAITQYEQFGRSPLPTSLVHALDSAVQPAASSTSNSTAPTMPALNEVYSPGISGADLASLASDLSGVLGVHASGGGYTTYTSGSGYVPTSSGTTGFSLPLPLLLIGGAVAVFLLMKHKGHG